MLIEGGFGDLLVVSLLVGTTSPHTTNSGGRSGTCTAGLLSDVQPIKPVRERRRQLISNEMEYKIWSAVLWSCRPVWVLRWDNQTLSRHSIQARSQKRLCCELA